MAGERRPGRCCAPCSTGTKADSRNYQRRYPFLLVCIRLVSLGGCAAHSGCAVCRPCYRAGGGRWGTLTDLNSASIGIELDNEVGEAFTEAQLVALLKLLDDLTTRLSIPKAQVIGHADMAPTRKRDPGSLFPWQRLAEAGYGLWPQGELVDPPAGFDPWLAMAAIGYPLNDRAAAMRAFHRHYRGRDDGEDPQAAFDAEDLRILHALSQQRLQPAAR
jgi:N-acetylmuramoyl-L-alanine amidase